jgi:Major capsid protein Gp23
MKPVFDIINDKLLDGLNISDTRLVKILLNNLVESFDRHSLPVNCTIKQYLNIFHILYYITAKISHRLITNYIIGVQPVVNSLSDKIGILQYNDDVTKLELVVRDVYPKVHKLCTTYPVSYPINTDKNMVAYKLGIDLEEELLQAVARDFAAEIDEALLNSLYARLPPATSANTYDQSVLHKDGQTLRDEFAALAVLIGRQANLIATRTRRNKGNWAVVSPTALTILEASHSATFCRFNSNVNSDPGPLYIKQVGMLNINMNIYCDPRGDDTTPVLIGYKGISEFDAGFFWSPYTLIELSGISDDEKTFKFNTRSSYTERDESDDKSWFGSVAVKNVSFL